MSNKKRIKASAAVAAAVAVGFGWLIPVRQAQANTYYWDNNSSTAGFGTAGGNWTGTSDANWTTDLTGASTPVGATTTTADTLNFGTTANVLAAGTITVTTANAGNITFAAGDGTIVLSAGTITLADADTITVNNASDTINSVLAGAGTSLTLAGTGTLTLSGANTYTGSTTVNTGTLKLDFSAAGAPATNIINSSSALVLGGATVSVTGLASTTNSQTFNGASILSGASAMAINNSATANPALVALGSISRTVGATINFTQVANGTISSTNGYTTGTTDTATTILGGWATINGTDWAHNNGTNIVALGSYTTASATVATDNAADIDLNFTSTTNITAAGAITPNSVRFSGGAANTLTLTGTNVIASGGVLNSSTVGANVSTITGGTLKGAANADLVLINNNTANSTSALAIRSIIADNTGATALTKSGAGLVTVNTSNTYTGGTVVNAGTLAEGTIAGFTAFGGNGTLANIVGNAALNTSGFSTQSITVNNGAVLALGFSTSNVAYNGTNYTTANNITLNGGSLLVYDGQRHLTGTLTIGAQGGTIGDTFGGDHNKGVWVDGALAGAGTLSNVLTNYANSAASFVGSDVFITGSSNTFTGTLNVNALTNGTNGVFNQGGNYIWLASTNAIANATLNLGGTINAGSGTQNGANALLFTAGVTSYMVSGLNGSGGLTLTNRNYTNGAGTANTTGGVGVTLSVGNNNASSAYSGVANGLGGIAKIGTGTLTLSGAANAYTGATIIENGALVVVAAAPSGSAGALGNATTAVALGDATSISSNLSPSLLTGGAFTVGRNITVGASNSATGGSYTVGGSTASTSTISGIETLNQSLSVTQVSGGTLNLTGNITSGASGTQTLSFGNAGAVSQSTGVIGGGTGTLAVTQSGAGTTTVAGANTYTGPTTISGGVLKVGSAEAAGTSGPLGNSAAANSGSIVFGGGTLQYSAANSNDYSGRFSTAPNQPISIDTNGRTVTFAAALTSSGGTLTKLGTGTLILTGTNTYSGSTTISVGTLQIGNGIIDGSISTSGGITDNAALVYNLLGSQTYGNPITGNGTLTKLGAGTLILTGANAASGTMTINGGALQVGNGTSGSYGAAAMTFGDTGTFNYQGVTTGSSQTLGALTFSAGAGTVQSTYGGTSSNTILTFASLAARTAGATGNFVSSGGANGLTNEVVFTAAPTAGALIDKGFYFNGADFAAYDSTGFVRALNYATTGGDTNTVDVNTITTGKHVKLTSSATGQAGVSLLTLNLSSSGVSWTQNAAQTLTLSGGGLTKSGGGTVGTISGGTGITTNGSTELVIRTDTAGDLLTLTTPILVTSTGGLTKTGLGTLTLSGTGNAYTGTTTVDAGVLTLTGTHTGGGDWIVRNTGTVNFNSGTTTTAGLTNAGVLNLTATSGGVAIANVNDAIAIANGKTWQIGNSSGVGVVNVAANISGGNSALDVGNSTGLGVMNVTSGTVTPGAYLLIGTGSAANSGGIVNISGTGSVSETSGGATISIGQSVNTMGVVNVSGNGSLSTNTATGIHIGEDFTGGAAGNTATGILNLSGSATATLGGNLNAQGLKFSSNFAALGVVNLGAVSGGGSGGTGGGTIITNVVWQGSASGTGLFNFHGGTLKSSATPNMAGGAFFSGLTAAYVYGEGGTIDNNSQSITIGQALLAPAGSGVISLAVTGTTAGFTPGATPLVTISSGGGIGTTAIANVDGSGNLTMTITNPGTGYTSTPTVTLTGGTASGSTTVTAGLGTNISGGLTFRGSGTTTLSGANSYSGGTTVNAGTLTIGTGGTLGATTGTLAVNNPNTGAGTTVVLNLATGADTTTGSLSGAIATPSSLTNTATINNGGASRNFTVNQTTAGTFAGVIAGSGTFTLGSLSTNKLTLSGANIYSGATAVNAGTLAVNGSLNSSANPVTVAEGAVLAGAGGTISRPVTLTSGTVTGGIITAGSGNTPNEGVGKLTLGVAATFGAASTAGNLVTYDWKYSSATGADTDPFANAGTNWDVLAISGLTVGTFVDVVPITITGTTSFAPGTNYKFDIVTGAGTDQASLDALALKFHLDQSVLNNTFASFVGASGNFTIGDDLGNSGQIYISYNAAPEPTSMLLLGLATGGLTLRRRRRSDAGEPAHSRVSMRPSHTREG
jgi:autotransporter-associated beta strand protein